MFAKDRMKKIWEIMQRQIKLHYTDSNVGIYKWTSLFTCMTLITPGNYMVKGFHVLEGNCDYDLSKNNGGLET
jgi:hypothetical protein